MTRHRHHPLAECLHLALALRFCLCERAPASAFPGRIFCACSRSRSRTRTRTRSPVPAFFSAVDCLARSVATTRRLRLRLRTRRAAAAAPFFSLYSICPIAWVTSSPSWRHSRKTQSDNVILHLCSHAHGCFSFASIDPPSPSPTPSFALSTLSLRYQLPSQPYRSLPSQVAVEARIATLRHKSGSSRRAKTELYARPHTVDAANGLHRLRIFIAHSFFD